MNFEEQAIEIITQVKHPAINNTLVNLGFVKSYDVKDKTVNVMMIFPSLTIPILDRLVNSIKNPLQEIGAEVNIELGTMTQEELQRFFYLETQGWKGLD